MNVGPLLSVRFKIILTPFRTVGTSIIGSFVCARSFINIKVDSEQTQVLCLVNNYFTFALNICTFPNSLSRLNARPRYQALHIQSGHIPPITPLPLLLCSHHSLGNPSNSIHRHLLFCNHSCLCVFPKGSHSEAFPFISPQTNKQTTRDQQSNQKRNNHP
jgi:hypothetical protein